MYSDVCSTASALQVRSISRQRGKRFTSNDVPLRATCSVPHDFESGRWALNETQKYSTVSEKS